MFVDETIVLARAGKGGDGCVAFLREKYRPKGGPSGGDGGRGGSVVLVADRKATTLLDLARLRVLRAPKGGPGRGKNCSGAAGRDVEIPVPVGTIVRELPPVEKEDPAAGTGAVRPEEVEDVARELASAQLIADLKEEGARVVIAAGGRGGRGNQHFATSWNRAPRKVEPGRPGEERRLHLELRLIADVGLVGMPNAGKSTLLSRVSAARPKIAEYPFTTLAPSVGIVDGGAYHQLVFADLPGLIEGAHAGVGLGVAFLRHLERTRLLVHLVELAPPDGSDPAENYRKIRRELEQYSTELARRPEIIAATKIDLPDSRAALTGFREALAPAEVHPVSAVTGEGVRELVGAAFRLAGEGGGRAAETAVAPPESPAKKSARPAEKASAKKKPKKSAKKPARSAKKPARKLARKKVRKSTRKSGGKKAKKVKRPARKPAGKK